MTSRRKPPATRAEPGSPGPTKQGGAELILFLGPSLPRAQAEAELAALAGPAKLAVRIEGPARQGDVWAALRLRPRVIALIDGVFESSPSVWHHELLDALDAGVLLFGASSMGALRASELQGQGMIGVGKIFARYRDGLEDDAAVALLHADAEHAFAPLTVPLLNAEHAIAQGLAAHALTEREAASMQRAAAALHYQERSWPALIERARLPLVARARWSAFAAKGLPDLKADDARLCLREAARAALAQRSAGARPEISVRAQPSSARVRARRAQQALAAGAVRERARGSVTAAAGEELVAQAERALFIAAVARAWGLAPGARELAAAREQLEAVATGLAEDELQRAAETLALEQLALDHAARLLPDGPSPIEAQRLAQLLRALDPRPKSR